MTTTGTEFSSHTVRVSVSIPGLNIDVPLPSNIPVDLVIADLIPFLRQTLKSQGLSTKWIDQLVRWKLTTKFGHRLAPTRSLDDQGVLHGDLILVEVEKTAEQFTPLIDDIADAVATIQQRTYPDYIPAHSVRLISYSLMGFSFIVAFFLGRFAQGNHTGLASWAPVILISLGVILLLTAWVMDKRNQRLSDEQPYPELVVTALLLSAFMWICSGVLTIIPRPLGAPQVLAASVTLLAVAAISSRVTMGHMFLHGSVIVPSILLAIAAALQIFVPQPLGTLGTEIMLMGAIAIFSTTKLSLTVARISLPPTPSPGEEHVTDNAIIAIGDLISSADTKIDGVLPTIAAEEEKRAIRQYVLSNAFLLGSVIAITVGAYLAADITAPYFWYIVAYILVISGILIFRGKSYSDLLNRSILYSGSILSPTVAWAHLVTQITDPLKILYFSAPLVLLILAFFIGIVQGRKLESPIARQRVEIIERCLYASIFPLITVISGLYFKARFHA